MAGQLEVTDNQAFIIFLKKVAKKNDKSQTKPPKS